MKILITGICGFAGNIVARGLLEAIPGAAIYGLDNLIRKGSQTNLEPLRARGIDVKVGDIRDSDVIEAIPDVDWVLDCAANPSVLAGVDGKTSSRDLLDHNLVGTINLLEYCRSRSAGFCLLSTSRVYSIEPLATLPVTTENSAFAPQTELPGLSRRGLSEAFSVDPPVSLYGASKRASELLALEYGYTFNFPVWINRCGVLAGAGQFGKADQGIFSYWIHSWARRRALKYIGFGGAGHQVRDCLHPSDIVPLLLKQFQDPGKPVSKIVNVSGGSRSAMSLAQLSAWCTDRLGAHEVQADLQPRPFDIPWIVLDHDQASSVWDWTPLVSRDQILEEIAMHAESNPDWLNTVA